MTREEARRIAQGLITNFKCKSETMVEFCNVVIEALEQEPTTKNDLGVDAILRAEVNQVIEDYMDEQYDVLSDRTRERAFGARAVMARINELPSVTPQEPILDKIRDEIDKARFIDKDTRICKNALASGLEVAIQIIDKYKGESEKNNAV